MHTTTVAGDRSVSLAKRLAFDVCLIASGSAVVALGAQVAIPLPFTPVPVTLQTLAVLVVAAALGCKRGGAALGLYLAEGAAGLPVFAGGAAGLGHLLGPTGGYAFGFVPAAVLVGWLADRGGCRSIGGAALTMTAGTAAIFICGFFWLAVLIGPGAAVAAGLVPFIPGAIIKITAASAAGPMARRLIARLHAHLGGRIAIGGDFGQ